VLPDGTCVSRYDASLVTQADVTFPYLKGLVAVPVQLLHEGGMAGGSPARHASAVMDALVKSANSFVSQIRAANKSVGALWRPPRTIVALAGTRDRVYPTFCGTGVSSSAKGTSITKTQPLAGRLRK
jgi:hypothetical protein